MCLWTARGGKQVVGGLLVGGVPPGSPGSAPLGCLEPALPEQPQTAVQLWDRKVYQVPQPPPYMLPTPRQEVRVVHSWRCPKAQPLPEMFSFITVSPIPARGIKGYCLEKIILLRSHALIPSFASFCHTLPTVPYTHTFNPSGHTTESLNLGHRAVIKNGRAHV